MKPEIDEMQFLEFKQFFHEKKPATVQFFSKKPEKKALCRSIHGTFNKDRRASISKGNLQGFDVGLLINSSQTGERKAGDITGINAVFVDIDEGKYTKQQLLNLPVAPHCIVETSPGNFHAYWKVRKCSVSRFRKVQKALADKLGTDPSVADPSRVMRLPGTLNFKRDEPFLARIVYRNAETPAIHINRFIRNMELKLSDGDSKNGPPIQSVLPSEKVSSRIRAALEKLPADDRWMWLRVGMAIHSAMPNDDGLKLWNNWSEKSAKYDDDEQLRSWKKFSPSGGVTLNTLFWLANTEANSQGGEGFDEMAMAQLFVETVKGHLLFLSDQGAWYTFTGVIWTKDNQAPVRAARAFISDLSKGGNVPKWLKPYRNAARFKGLVNHAELLPEIQARTEIFDQNSNLFTVKNGVVDLVSGGFREALPNDYLLRSANVAYDPDAKCPTFRKFLRDITGQDKGLMKFLRFAMGYTIFGNARLQKFFIAVGSGGNGKGTFMRTMKGLMGDYATSVAPNLLTTAYGNNANSPSPALASLLGARLVACTELPTGKRLDEAFVKQFSGGDDITARQPWGELFSFKPEGKMWLSTNEMPYIRADDNAMWRRLVPVPFKAEFVTKGRDDFLDEKLEAEYPGILNWLIRGAVAFGKSWEVPTCGAVEEMEAKMRKEADSIAAWLEASCRLRSKAVIQSSHAYESYVKFMKASERKPLSMPSFKRALVQKGHHHKKRNDSNCFLGFSIAE